MKVTQQTEVFRQPQLASDNHIMRQADRILCFTEWVTVPSQTMGKDPNYEYQNFTNLNLEP